MIESVPPSVNKAGELVTTDMGKAEVLSKREIEWMRDTSTKLPIRAWWMGLKNRMEIQGALYEP